jgi:phosphomevalonate kinase
MWKLEGTNENGNTLKYEILYTNLNTSKYTMNILKYIEIYHYYIKSTLKHTTNTLKYIEIYWKYSINTFIYIQMHSNTFKFIENRMKYIINILKYIAKNNK